MAKFVLTTIPEWSIRPYITVVATSAKSSLFSYFGKSTSQKTEYLYYCRENLSLSWPRPPSQHHRERARMLVAQATADN